MMQIYRISKEKYAGDLSGLGAKKYGGRWNPIGMPVVYGSSSRALAVLELIVHINAKRALDHTYCITTIEVDSELFIDIPPAIIPIKAKELDFPIHWQITQDCFNTKHMLAMQVPSIIVPQEKNYILHVDHAKFEEQVKVLNIEPFAIDIRLSS